jgi:hypothetical protein
MGSGDGITIRTDIGALICACLRTMTVITEENIPDLSFCFRENLQKPVDLNLHTY